MNHAPLKMLVCAALALSVVSMPAFASDDNSQSSGTKKVALYPNATRAEPKLDLKDAKEQKTLNDGLDAANAGDQAKATQLLQPIIDNSKSKYAQAIALQAMASLDYKAGNTKKAITQLKASLDNGVMPNDTYFQLEFELAQFYAADQQYQLSLDTIAKWRAEGKLENADSYALEGEDYYRLQKYPEAIAAIKKAQSLTDKPNNTWNQILLASYSESGQSDKAAQLAQTQVSADPNDPTAVHNAVAVLMQAQKYPEAIQLLEKQQAAGGLKTEADYVDLAKLYLVTSQQGSADPKPSGEKAVAVMNDGFSKGIVTKTGDNYTLLGNAAYIADEPDQALAAYSKALPLATDGEPAVHAAQMLLVENKYNEAKSMIEQGIAKGVPHKGQAYMILGEANRGLKNKPAAIAAVKIAEQDPETASKAKAWLQQAGASN
jgi:hypothetical protein